MFNLMDSQYPIPAKKERNEQIVRDYQAGMALYAIADKYRIRPARVDQILKKQGVERNRIKKSKEAKNYQPSSSLARN